MYYEYDVVYRREWGEIHNYYFTRKEAEKAEESGAYAGCGRGEIRCCHRDASLPDYERIHWYN